MKTGKFKIFLMCLIAFAAMAAFSVSASAVSGACGDDLVWSLNNEGVLKISGNGPMTDYFYVGDVPWYDYRADILKVEMEEGITGISSDAFAGCENLTRVIVAETVTSMGDRVFYGCTSLERIIIPPGVKSIGERFFEGNTSLVSVTLQAGLQSIGTGAFYGCVSLGNLYIPNTVTQIGNHAFSDCTALASITLPDYAESIGYGAFSGCSKLKKVTFPLGVTNIESQMFWGCTNLEEVNLPANITSIGIEAFANCTALETFRIPETVTSIGSSAFYGCKRLYRVEFNAVNCETMGSKTNPVFEKCPLLTQVSIGDSAQKIPDYAFYKCDDIPDIAIPDSVVTVGIGAFYGCTGLQSVHIGSDVTSIGEEAFYECKGLTVIVIPDSVQSIGNKAFFYCNNITTLVLGNGIRSIGNEAFNGCGLIESIEIPDAAQSIGSSAFNNCYSLTSVTFGTDLKTIGDSAFSGCTLTSIDLPEGLVSIGSNAFSNSIYIESLIIPDSVTLIGKGAFFGMSELTEITLPFIGASRSAAGSFDAVFGYVFGYAANESQTGPEGAEYQFNDGETYYHYYIPDKLKKVTITDDSDIPAYAFYNCVSLEEISLPEDITAIGRDAFTNSGFYNNSSNWEDDGLYVRNWLVTQNFVDSGEYTLKSDVIGIVGGAFSACRNMCSITLPNSVLWIGEGAFASCTKLTEANYLGNTSDWEQVVIEADNAPLVQLYIKCLDGEAGVVVASGECGPSLTFTLNANGVLLISGSGAMDDFNSYTGGPWSSFSSSIKEVVLLEGVTSVGDYAFYNCTGMRTLTLPGSIEAIGISPFDSCTSLNTLNYNIKECTSYLEYSAFKDCNLTTLYIGSEVTMIPESLFIYSTGLQALYYDGTMGEWQKIEVMPGNETLVIQDKQCTDGTITGIVASGSLGEGISYELTFSGTLVIKGDGPMPDGKVDLGDLSSERVKKITIEEGITHIGESAFEDFAALTEVSLPESLSSIGSRAFYQCSVLQNITLPDSLKSIGETAFGYCENLTAITIPANVESIGDSAFYKSALTELIYNAKNMGSSYSSPFKDCTSLTTVIIGEEVENIPDYAFNLSTIENVSIPEGVVTIGAYAFSNSNAQSITIPASVTSIGDGAFSDMFALTNLTFNATNCTYMGNYKPAFDGCSRLAAVTFGENVKSISDYAFKGCEGLQYAELPEGLLSIGKEAFYRCTSLKDITIPSSATHIDTTAFSYSGLERLSFYAVNCTSMKEAFESCQNLTSVAIGEGVKHIPDFAFSGCISIRKITLPDSVESIGESAFGGTGLRSAIVPDSVNSIGANAFESSGSNWHLTLYSSAEAYAHEYALSNAVSWADLDSLPLVKIEDAVRRVDDLLRVTLNAVTVSEDFSAEVFAAVYNESMDQFIDILPAEPIFEEVSDYYFDITGIDSDTVIKVFVWSGTKALMPMGEAYNI